MLVSPKAWMMGHAACISCGDSLHGGLDGGDALAHLTGALVPLGLRIKHWRGRIDECAVGALPAAARSIPMTPRELCDLRGAFPELGLERPGLWCSALLRQSIHMRASESRGGRLCLMSRLWSEFHLLDLLLVWRRRSYVMMRDATGRSRPGVSFSLKVPPWSVVLSIQRNVNQTPACRQYR